MFKFLIKQKSNLTFKVFVSLLIILKYLIVRNDQLVVRCVFPMHCLVYPCQFCQRPQARMPDTLDTLDLKPSLRPPRTEQSLKKQHECVYFKVDLCNGIIVTPNASLLSIGSMFNSDSSVITVDISGHIPHHYFTCKYYAEQNMY